MISISNYTSELVHKPRRHRGRKVARHCNICKEEFKPAFAYQRFCKHCRSVAVPKLSAPEFDVTIDYFNLHRLEAA